jgi:hypothetical protein
MRKRDRPEVKFRNTAVDPTLWLRRFTYPQLASIAQVCLEVLASGGPGVDHSDDRIRVVIECARR